MSLSIYYQDILSKYFGFHSRNPFVTINKRDKNVLRTYVGKNVRINFLTCDLGNIEYYIFILVFLKPSYKKIQTIMQISCICMRLIEKTTPLNTKIYSFIIIKEILLYTCNSLTIRYKYEIYIFPNNLHQFSSKSKLGFDFFFYNY